MTYEKDIPDFALVPAKPPEERMITPLTENSIHSTMQVTNMMETAKTEILIEEDILVPDTRPDLKSILMMDGSLQINQREGEKSRAGSRSETATISGEIALSTLYVPEKADMNPIPIPIQNRISFQEPWNLLEGKEGNYCLEGKIEKLHYHVVNERKFRVKILVGVEMREWKNLQVELFEGLQNETIEMRKEDVEVTGLALRKKELFAVEELFVVKEGEAYPESIIKQEISIVDHQRQTAAEKMVINGSIGVNLLYLAEDGLHQLKEKIEFTQFIPLSRSGTWSGSRVAFDCSELKAKVSTTEEGAGAILLEGELITWLELYENEKRQVIVDCYHQEKDFLCDYEEIPCKRLVSTIHGETSMREIVTAEGEVEPEVLLFSKGEVTGCECRTEAGKVVVEGVLRSKILWRGSLSEGEEGLCSQEDSLPFRAVLNLPQISGHEKVSCQVCVKDFWAERLTGKQMEVNATLFITGEAVEKMPVKVLKNPAFEQGSTMGEGKGMVVYVVKEGDDLWNIGKVFKATRESMRQINQLGEEDLVVGRKLLIIK